jgi:hypothetical protein
VSSVATSWVYGVQAVYLTPANIPPHTRFSWDQQTVDEIKKRNPSLANETFLLPSNTDRPFPIVGTTLVGPAEGGPYKSATQNYTMLEVTPLYVGQFHNLEVNYQYDGDESKVHQKLEGGAVEPYAFSVQGKGPANGIPSGQAIAQLSVPPPEIFMDLSFAAGASSYAPGSVVESLSPHILADDLALHFDYWPAASPQPETTDTYFCDGGAYQNIPLINYLQRGVQKIVLFFASSVPLQPFSMWNVTTDPYSDDQITSDLASFFGAFPASQPDYENRTFEYERNQVFALEDYATVITALQTAQQEGRGIVAAFNLTTVQNDWWGIAAGQQHEVVFSYLGRLPQWEAELSPEMYKLLVPEKDTDNYSVDIDEGPFRNFPHYTTSAGDINYERANVLSNLYGWGVLQHEDIFRRVLS